MPLPPEQRPGLRCCVYSTVVPDSRWTTEIQQGFTYDDIKVVSGKRTQDWQGAAGGSEVGAGTGSNNATMKSTWLSQRSGEKTLFTTSILFGMGCYPICGSFHSVTNQAVEALNILSGPNSMLRRLLRAIEQETALMLSPVKPPKQPRLRRSASPALPESWPASFRYRPAPGTPPANEPLLTTLVDQHFAELHKMIRAEERNLPPIERTLAMLEELYAYEPYPPPPTSPRRLTTLRRFRQPAVRMLSIA